MWQQSTVGGGGGGSGAGSFAATGAAASMHGAAPSSRRGGVVDGAAAGPAPNAPPNSVFLSVVDDGPNLAFAAYDENRNAVSIEQCGVDGYQTEDLVERVLAAFEPTLLLLPPKVVGNASFLELLTTPPVYVPLEDEEDDDDDGRGRNQQYDETTQPRSIPYRVVKSSSLDVRTCRSIIMKLRVKSIMQQQQLHAAPSAAGGGGARRNFPLDPSERSFDVSHYHALASVVDFDSKVQVQALGSLLEFLQATIFQHVEGNAITVNDVEHAHASNFVKLSRDTFQSLHIFATEYHPLLASSGRGNNKEGFSLFSLLDRTKTKAGRDRLKSWMLKPLMDVDMIRNRQNGVELFTLSQTEGAKSRILDALKRIGPVAQVLVRMQKSNTKPSDFLVLSKTISHAIAILEVLDREVLFPLKQRVHSGGAAAASGFVPPSAQQMLPPSGSNMMRGAEASWHQHQLAEEMAASAEGLSTTENYIAFLEHILDRCNVQCLYDLLKQITSVVDEDATAENTGERLFVRRGFHEELDAMKDQYANLGGTFYASTIRSLCDHLLGISCNYLPPYHAIYCN